MTPVDTVTSSKAGDWVSVASHRAVIKRLRRLHIHADCYVVADIAKLLVTANGLAQRHYVWLSLGYR